MVVPDVAVGSTGFQLQIEAFRMNERTIFRRTAYLCAQTSVLEDLVDEQPGQHVARDEEDLAKYHADVDVRGQQPGQEGSVAVGGPVVGGSSLPKFTPGVSKSFRFTGHIKENLFPSGPGR